MLKVESLIEMEELLNDKNWENLIQQLHLGCNLTQEEFLHMQDSLTAKLIAAVVYFSNCPDVDRVAIVQLSIYIIANRCRLLFNHRDETIANRMKLLCFFPGGNEEVKKAGFILLQLISLYDHLRDYAYDIENNKQNPLFKINFEQECNRLWNEFYKMEKSIQNKYNMFTKFIPFMWWW